MIDGVQMSDNNGKKIETDKLDGDITDLAELCGSMIQFYKNLMKNAAVGGYYYFASNSLEGTDCCHVQKSKQLFLERKEDILRGLKINRDELDNMIKRLEKRTKDE